MSTSPSVARSPANWWKWFDPRSRQVGTIAFILNRITGLGLAFYLFLHLVMLGNLARGPQAYDSFIATVRSPLFTAGEFLVVAGGLIHGLNGLRVLHTSFGIAVRREREIFLVLMALALAGCLVFALRMFGGHA